MVEVPQAAGLRGVRMKGPAVILLVAWLSVGLGGCLEGPGPPDLGATVFRVDEIRYWWEDEFLIVNLTIRNQQEFTPGIDAAIPWLRVIVEQHKRTTEPAHSYDDVIYRQVGGNTFTLYFESNRDEAWKQRWYDESARKALGVDNNASYRQTTHGPIVFPPNASVSPEIVFKPGGPDYSGKEGYYAIQVRVLADYPREYEGRVEAFTEYYSGCFNRDTPEFYGYDRATGRVCNYWNCLGDDVSEYSIYKTMGKPRPEWIPDCSATDAVGPYYEG